MTKSENETQSAHTIVLTDSSPLDEEMKRTVIRGPNMNDPLFNLSDMFAAYSSVGFQASAMGEAISIINEMIERKQRDGCTIFLGYTSNLVSSGLREVFRFLAQHRLVDCIVTTAGGIEEDFIKCLGKTYLSSFDQKGEKLRKLGLNRVGNLVIPNSNYCAFEDWVIPLLDDMLEQQKTDGVVWSPSKTIDFLGKMIDNEDSIYYWAHKVKISDVI
jgi:deoxyhypusine synthase